MSILSKEQYLGLKKKLFLEGAFSFAHTTLLQSIFLIGFALAIGANNFQIGILLAIPLFANLLQLVSAYILEATGTKKVTTLVSLFFGRILWVIIILMAFGFMEHHNKILLFATVLFMSNILAAIGNLSLLSWLKDLVPVNRLGRFLGKRNMYASAGGVVVYLIGAFAIDRFPGIRIYAYLFMISLVIGLLALLYLRNIPDKRGKIKAMNPKKFFGRLKKPFKDAYFRPLLSFGMFWAFSINLASPFFIVFMLNDLSLSFFLVSSMLIVDTLARLYGLNIWRKMSDHSGAKPILTVTATVTSFIPLAFVFINHSNYLLIYVIMVISAISYAGVDIAIGQLLFKSAPRKYDAYYLSSFSSLNGLTSALGPIIGGLLAIIIRTRADKYFLNIFAPLKYLFIISFLLRISCIPLIAKIHEKKAVEVGAILERMKNLGFVSFFINIYDFTSYTSKIVLIPQKQFFILQRRAAEKVKRVFKRKEKVQN